MQHLAMLENEHPPHSGHDVEGAMHVVGMERRFAASEVVVGRWVRVVEVEVEGVEGLFLAGRRDVGAVVVG